MTLHRRITVAADKMREMGGEPQRVYLRSADAIQLQYELLAEGGRVGHAIMQGGIHRAVSSILGLRIVWKSHEFRVA